MTLYLKELEDRQRGFEEGKTEGRVNRDNEILANMQKAGFSPEMIALALGTDKPLFSATH